MRLFIAVSVQAAEESLCNLLRELRSTGADFKWVRPEQFHLTLQFLGNLEPGVVEAVGAAMREAAEDRPAFGLRLSGLGAFPDWKRPRVIWIGADEGGPALSEITQALGAALRGKNVPLPEEGREFTPHLTLGRMRGPSGLGRLKAQVERLAERDLGIPKLTVERLLLIESRLSAPGPSYTVLREARLRAGSVPDM